MKRLTDAQKKWTLAFGLVSALSFNMVMSVGVPFGAASFASSEKTDKFSTSSGVYKVTFTKDGDKTVARFSEGTKTRDGADFCIKGPACMSQVVVSEEFESDIDVLQSALREEIERHLRKKNDDGEKIARGSTTTAAKDVATADEDDRTDKKSDKKSEDKEKRSKELADLKDKCEDKDEEYRLECFADGLTSLLSDPKKKFEQSEVKQIYGSEIEKPLIMALSLAQRGVFPDTEKVDAALTIIDKMLSDIDKKYLFIRQRLIQVANTAVRKAAKTTQSLFQKSQAEVNAGNPMGMQTMQLARGSMINMNNLSNQLKAAVGSGIDSAYSLSNVSDDQAQQLYINGFVEPSQAVLLGMLQNPYNYAIPMNDTLSGYSVIDPTTGSFVSTLQPRTTLVQTIANPTGSPIQQQTIAVGGGVYALQSHPTVQLGQQAPRMATQPGYTGRGTVQIVPVTAGQLPQR